ncbi:hypothetical protein LCGC14_1620900, partial [marine sediment metagenome]
MLLVGGLQHRFDVRQPGDRFQGGIELPRQYATLTLGRSAGSGNLGRFLRTLAALFWCQLADLL